MTRAWMSAAAFAVISLLTLPAAARGAERPDPDSPAGVEYQLPLDRAREEASTGGGSGNGSSNGSGGRAPLFGEGIARASGSGGGDSSSSGDGSAAGGDGDESHVAGDGGESGDEDSADLKRASLDAPSGSGGGSGGLGTGWIVLAVLGAGAALGLLLRRGLRDPSG